MTMRIIYTHEGKQRSFERPATQILVGRPQEALACSERALALDPKVQDGWYNGGADLAKPGRDEEALACYDRALAVNPQCAEAWFNKGGALWRLGRHEEALACYDRAVTLHPWEREAWYGKGAVLATQLRRFREAIPFLRKRSDWGTPTPRKQLLRAGSTWAGDNTGLSEAIAGRGLGHR